MVSPLAISQKALKDTFMATWGEAGGALVATYSAVHYNEKLQKIMDYDKQLNEHRETLVSLQNRVKQYWEGDAAERYNDVLSKQLALVDDMSARLKEASDYLNKVIESYREMKDEHVGKADRAHQVISTFMPK